MGFLQQLKQRRVVRGAAVYAATAFVVLQAADLLATGLDLPDWVFSAVTIVAVVGFPIALVLAWAFQVTTHGVQRESADEAPSHERVLPARTVALVVALLLLGALGGWLLRPAEHDPDDALSLAVLPFSNLGAAEDEYFADGMTNALRGKLAALEGMTVISSSSSRRYRGSDKTPRDIGRELGVRYLLTGTVRWAKNGDGSSRVQVNPELISVSNGTTRWQEPFDAVLADVFAVQGAIASRVADALSVTLLERSREQLSERPTNNLAAYDAFLRASALLQQAEIGAPTRRLAADGFRRAVDLDPGFAVAWAQMSYAHIGAYWFIEDTSEERLRLARASADSALALDPDLPEALVADGYYWYWGFRNYERGLDRFQRALRQDRNNGLALLGVASVRRRQGRVADALEGFRQFVRINPREASSQRELAVTLVLAGNYAEADQRADSALNLAPEAIGTYLWKTIALYGQEKPLEAQAALREMVRVLGAERAAIELTNRSWSRWLPLVDSATLRVMENLSLSSQVVDTGGFYVMRAEWLRHIGERARAAALADSGVHFFNRAPTVNSDWWYDAQLAIAHALAGSRAQAEARLGSMLAVFERTPDAFDYKDAEYAAAKTYAYLGDRVPTLRHLEAAMRPPTRVVRGLVRADTRFALLRGDPRFEAMIRPTR